LALAQCALAQRAMATSPVVPPVNTARAASEADLGPHPVLDRIRASGRIVLAHRESSIPFSYYDADKHPVGYALDLCKSLAEAVRVHLGLKTLDVAYVPVTTGNRIDTIVSGRPTSNAARPPTTQSAARRSLSRFRTTSPAPASRSEPTVRSPNFTSSKATFLFPQPARHHSS